MRKLLLALMAVFALSNMDAQTLQDATKMLNYENFPRAKKALQLYIQQVPSSQEGQFALGALLSRTGKIDSAIILFNKVIELNPKPAISNVAAGYIALNKKNIPDAQASFEKAIKNSKSKDGNIFRMIGEAWLYSPNQNLEEAIENLKKAVAIEIKNPVSYFSLGEAYYKKGELGQAVTQYEFTTDYDKTAAWAFCRIGEIFKNAKNYPKSNESLESALKADADYPNTYKELADWYYDYQKYPEALTNFEKYLKLTGDASVETKIRYGAILFYTKQYDKTISMVNDILKVDSSRNYMIRLLAYSYFEQGDSLAARNMMNKYFSKASPEKIIYSDYQYMGKINIKFGQDSLAYLNYEKAIATDSTKVDLYNELATLYYSKAKYLDAARIYSKKLAKLDKPSLQNYFDIAFAYYKGQDYSKAIIAFGKISEKWPDRLEGHVYQARSAAFLDPESTQKLASPYYGKVIEKGEVDPVKYKDYLNEAYSYMYYLAFNDKDKATAKGFADKMLKLDPNNAEAVKMLKATE